MCGDCLRFDRRTMLLGAASLPLLSLAAPNPTEDATTTSTPTTTTTLPSPTAIEVTPGLRIEPRATWAGDSRPARGELFDEDVRFLLVHHTASENGADPVATMRFAYEFHTGPEKGWPDVAYNFFIDQFGTVYEARTDSLVRAVEASATGGSQGFAQLVCLLGNFTSELPTPEALDSLYRTLAWLADRHELDTSPGAVASFESRGSNLWPEGTPITTPTISGHRDMSATACPGDTFYPFLVERAAAEVSPRRSGSTLPLPPPPSTTTTLAPTTTSTTLPTTTSSTTLPPATSSTSTTTSSTTTSSTTTSSTTTSSTSIAPSSTSTTTPSATTGGPATTAATGGTEAATSNGSTTRNVAAGGLVAAGLAGLGVVGLARRRRSHLDDPDDPMVSPPSAP